MATCGFILDPWAQQPWSHDEDPLQDDSTWDKMPDATQQSLRDNAWTIYRNSKSGGGIEVACESLRPLLIPVLLIQGEKTAL